MMRFQSFDAKTIQDTTVDWMSKIEKNQGFEPQVRQALDWAQRNMAAETRGQDSYEVAYGVFHDKNECATAICEVHFNKHGSNSKWMKMLNVRLNPSLEAGVYIDDAIEINLAVEAYICCVLGVLGIKETHNADTVKIYGRSEFQKLLLVTFADKLNAGLIDKAYNVTVEGRWLVVKRVKKNMIRST